MTSTVTQVTITTLMTVSPGTLSRTIGVVAIVVLLVLLAEKELERVLVGPRAPSRIHLFNIAVTPLLLAFGIVIIMRFLRLLKLA